MQHLYKLKAFLKNVIITCTLFLLNKLIMKKICFMTFIAFNMTFVRPVYNTVSDGSIVHLLCTLCTWHITLLRDIL